MILQIELQPVVNDNISLLFKGSLLNLPIEIFSADEINDYSAALVQCILDKWRDKQLEKPLPLKPKT